MTLKVSSNLGDSMVVSILFHAYSKVPVMDLIPKRTFSSFALQKFTSLALFQFLISEIISIPVIWSGNDLHDFELSLSTVILSASLQFQRIL